MKTSRYIKLFFITALITSNWACSSGDDNNVIPQPDIPTEPEPNSPLHITDGVVTGVDDGYSDIVFPKGVKRIRKGAFAQNNEIRKFTLNEGLEAIEEDAFFNSSIAEINFPSSLKEIEKYAFYNCKNLTKADLSLTPILSLPEGVFGFSRLRSVALPANLTKIGIQAFISTSTLADIVVPANVISIDSEAFRESGITSVRLPNNLSSLNQRAFYLCSNLRKVETYGEIKEDNTNGSIGAYCFTGSLLIEVFEIPHNIRILSQGILNSPNITAITIPYNVNYIDFAAFSNSGIKNVIVEASTPPTTRLVGGKWYGFPDEVESIRVLAGTAPLYKSATGWSEFADKIQTD